MKAPKRITVEEANKLLSKGFTVKNPRGTTVRFGRRALNYLNKKTDGDKRKEFLIWAKQTVSKTVPETLLDREIYTAIFTDEQQKKKGFIVLVSIRNGEVWDFYRKEAKALIKRSAR